MLDINRIEQSVEKMIEVAEANFAYDKDIDYAHIDYMRMVEMVEKLLSDIKGEEVKFY